MIKEEKIDSVNFNKKAVSKKDTISLINNYFKDIILTKISNNPALYRSKISCSTCDGYKYIVAFADDRNPIGYKLKLSSISWKNIQTRTYKEDLATDEYSLPNSYLDLENFRVVDRNKKRTMYNCDTDKMYVPIKLELLHTGKSEYEYSDTVRLDAALNTFQCSITLI